MANMHAVVENRIVIGFEAYRSLAARIPFFWPLLPLLYLWPIPIIGNRIYRAVADSRVCSLRPLPTRTVSDLEIPCQPGSFLVRATGSSLIVSSIIFGVANIGFAWPLASYPTFAGITGPEIDLPQIAVVSSTGEIVPMNERSLNLKLGKERYWGLMGQILSAENVVKRRIRIKALWQLWGENEPWVKQADSIRCHRLTLLTIPERQRENPVQKNLLFEEKIKDFQVIAANQ